MRETNKQQQSILVCGLSVILVLLVILTEIAPSNYTIIDESGKQFEIKYLSPKIFVPSISLKDVNVGDIGPINVEEVQRYLKGKDKMSIALGLQNIQNPQLTYQAQYYYYNKKYNLDQSRSQIPFCIVSPYKNFFSGLSWEMYLDTLEHQNYTNYQVLLTDDVSTDNSVEKILELVTEKYPRLSHRLKIIKNRQYVEMMGNHDIGIRNYCKQGTIIAEVDGDDTLLGRQVLNVLNAAYQEKPDTWVVYTNYLMKNRKGQFQKMSNKQIPEQVYDDNSYRSSGLWLTSHLKTYRREVYMKIPPKYFQRSPGKYHLYGADTFIMVAIIELSGKLHTKFFDELTYYYQMPPYGCSALLNIIGEKSARMQTPFMPLNSLKESAKLATGYTIPPVIFKTYDRTIDRAATCVAELRNKIKDQNYMQKIDLN